MPKNSREVALALVDQRVDDNVHDWHQNQDQNRVDRLVGGWDAPSALRKETQRTKERKMKATKSLTCMCSGWISIKPCCKRREIQSESGL